MSEGRGGGRVIGGGAQGGCACCAGRGSLWVAGGCVVRHRAASACCAGKGELWEMCEKIKKLKKVLAICDEWVYYK